MQREKHLIMPLLLYFGLLLMLVIVSLYNHINYIDLGYMVVVVCCALKFFKIVNTK